MQVKVVFVDRQIYLKAGDGEMEISFRRKICSKWRSDGGAEATE